MILSQRFAHSQLPPAHSMLPTSPAPVRTYVLVRLDLNFSEFPCVDKSGQYLMLSGLSGYRCVARLCLGRSLLPKRHPAAGSPLSGALLPISATHLSHAAKASL
ncbi:hypothetical protein FRC08_011628 [Ceratobasidium sp. 394]|nr:hypothetical protein FRC08_011628 [Ceratobasidium sp. 394]